MRKLTIIFLLLPLITSLTINAENWPFPQDTPQSETLDVGLAGDMPVDISRFLLANGPLDAALSPDGINIAYTSRVTGLEQLWVMPAKGGQPRQLTFGNGISFFTWHPDSQTLLYGADNDGDEREAYFLISLDGLKENLILPSSKAYREFGDFNPSGTQFTYASTERNGRDFDLYVHDIAKQSSSLIYQAEFGFYPDAWRPGTNQILVTQTRGEDANNLYSLTLGSNKLTTLFKPQIAAAFEDMVWLKDGSGFYFTANQHGEMKQIQFYDMTHQQATLIASADYDLEDLALCNSDNFLVWTENQNGFEQLYSLDRASKVSRRIEMPQGAYSLSCSDNAQLLVKVSSSQTPSDLILVDLAKLTQQRVLEANLAGINRATLKAPKVITFKARDGVQVQGLLYLPGNTGDQLPPVVVDIHGGPTAQSKPVWQPLTQYLVGKGIAVLDINVRGSTGFGKTYARLDNQEKRLDSVRDLVDALAWMKDDGRVDANRAAAIGGSYGGYMVNAVMGAYPDAFAAGASFVGVADWVKALRDASPGLKASDLIEYGDIREPKWQTFYANNSPINTVDKITAPMFFQHGVNDPRDPVTESDTMVKALRKKNIPVTYLRFDDEGHSISKLENRVIFYRQLAAFLEQHL